MARVMQIRRTKNKEEWRGAFAALLLQWIPVDSACDALTLYDRLLAARETYGLPGSQEEAVAEIIRAVNFLYELKLVQFHIDSKRGVFLSKLGAFNRTLMNPTRVHIS